MSTRALYAFSGDPITWGHMDIIRRAHALFSEIVVAIGTNPDKRYTFTPQEREQLAREALKGLPGVTVQRFDGLLVDFAYEQKIPVIVKGVRNPEDFRYEQTLSHVGLSQDQGIETLLLFARPELAHVSSSAVKAVQKEHGLTQDYVPLAVKVALEKKLSDQVIIGITGEIATGKSHVAQFLIQKGKEQRREVHNVELDHLAHEIQNDLSEPQYIALRKTLVKTFGEKIQNTDGTLNRQVLGEIVFSDLEKLKQLNELMWKPVLVRLRKTLREKKGLILVNAALLTEADLMAVCNNRVIFTSASAETQHKRLKERDLTEAQMQRRLDSQLSAAKKQAIMKQEIKTAQFGKIWEVSEKTDLSEFANRLFSEIL